MINPPILRKKNGVERFAKPPVEKPPLPEKGMVDRLQSPPSYSNKTKRNQENLLKLLLSPYVLVYVLRIQK